MSQALDPVRLWFGAGRLAKADLVIRIIETIPARRPAQIQAARSLKIAFFGVGQTDVGENAAAPFLDLDFLADALFSL